ncbi:hypothetical protein IQ229_04605 [Nostoc cf. edaphicum LEGE 07299]|uniref:Bacterial alpha-2-macroglobulin MG10 domain-containing protein n=1 Tax=Nostoc cf. edaphicum LEGE 07299 TaxID=2777974 RepID=A0ABR9TV15_9NOSO|nr:hypothetical protein [Nostoc edaphicum]MBE9104245.1 hypothetical protein [Nostoc cf. edaphicum LEGE 07299]
MIYGDRTTTSKRREGDRIIAYADHLEPGVYSLHYLVRSVTPGTFSWSGAEVHLQYAPEEFGRTAESILIPEDGK